MAKPVIINIPDASIAKSAKAAFKVLAAGTELHRIHPSRFEATQFNDTTLGNARFSPIRNAAGDIIPTIYAAKSFECAACEIILRCPELPETDPKTGLRPVHIVYPSDFTAHAHSAVVTTADLKLVDVTTAGQRKIGVDQSALLAGTKLHYPETRAWAEKLHADLPEAQGLYYTSVQWGEYAVVLFGDRVPADIFTALSSVPVSDPDTDAAVRILADGLSIDYFDV